MHTHTHTCTHTHTHTCTHAHSCCCCINRIRIKQREYSRRCRGVSLAHQSYFNRESFSPPSPQISPPHQLQELTLQSLKVMLQGQRKAYETLTVEYGKQPSDKVEKEVCACNEVVAVTLLFFAAHPSPSLLSSSLTLPIYFSLPPSPSLTHSLTTLSCVSVNLSSRLLKWKLHQKLRPLFPTFTPPEPVCRYVYHTG